VTTRGHLYTALVTVGGGFGKGGENLRLIGEKNCPTYFHGRGRKLKNRSVGIVRRVGVAKGEKEGTGRPSGKSHSNEGSPRLERGKKET